MIYAGKELYLKDLLLPETTDADKIGYKPEQIKWCQENEGYMWRYFIENKMLYDTDQKLIPRFIAPAPFSKFYLEIDNESHSAPAVGLVGKSYARTWKTTRFRFLNYCVAMPRNFRKIKIQTQKG
jgi:hypothetical protein